AVKNNATTRRMRRLRRGRFLNRPRLFGPAMDPLLAAFISAGFIVALEFATHWLVGFPVALAIFIAVAAAGASGSIFSAFQRRRRIASLLSLIPPTVLLIVALLTWSLLVFNGVRGLEAEMQFVRI